VLLHAANVCARDECVVWDVAEDWSDASNPTGPWTYAEGTNALPHVDWWERDLGSFSSAQPGWADSEDGTDRIPFWFKSNGVIPGAFDWQAGDVVVHTTDDANGIGNGPANLIWTSPIDGFVTVAGAVWIAREIGRGNDWAIFENDEELTHGNVASGDPYSRAAPFDFVDGSGGAQALAAIPVSVGDTVRLQLAKSSQYGDFTGVRFTVTCATPPTTTTTSTTTSTTTLPPAGVCGDPVAPPALVVHGRDAFINASDALAVLQTAVHIRTCPLCVCDVNDSASVTATDALIVLRFAVGQSVLLTCPAC